jgi:hypothetical protein
VVSQATIAAISGLIPTQLAPLAESGGDLCRTLMKYRAGHGEEMA